MNRFFHIATLCLALALVLFLPGCDIFTTRDAESPSESGSGYIPATSPDIVIENLQNAVADKNSSDYLRCFVDTLSSDRSFQFIPTAGAAARYPATFANWTLQSEQSYFSNLTALSPDDATAQLVLTGGFDLTASDSAVYVADYQLTFHHGMSSIAEVVNGTMQLTLATDRSNFWGIVKWTDLPSGTDASWSDLKGGFAN